MTKKIKGLTIHFIPNSEIFNLDSTHRIKKLLNILMNNKVIVLQGRLRAEEETRLIEDTLIMVGKVKGFKGIELAVITPDLSELDMMSKLKHGIANALIGKADNLTVIGPASLIKEMKKDPKKLEIMMNDK